MGTTTVVIIANGSGKWTCPAGVTSVQVEVWGAGAGGRTGGTGGGGGGGAYAASSAYAVVGGSTYSFSIGTAVASGNSGGSSWWVSSTTLKAAGGSSTTTTAGGAGGTAGATGTTVFAGGAGGTGTGASGGGGGGAGGPDGAGVAGAALTGGAGDNSNANGGTGGAAGAAGGSQDPGTGCAGGGGGGSGGSGGTPGGGGGAQKGGAAGQIRLTYTGTTQTIYLLNNYIAARTNLFTSSTLSLQNYALKGTGYSELFASNATPSGKTALKGATNTLTLSVNSPTITANLQSKLLSISTLHALYNRFAYLFSNFISVSDMKSTTSGTTNLTSKSWSDSFVSNKLFVLGKLKATINSISSIRSTTNISVRLRSTLYSLLSGLSVASGYTHLQSKLNSISFSRSISSQYALIKSNVNSIFFSTRATINSGVVKLVSFGFTKAGGNSGSPLSLPLYASGMANWPFVIPPPSSFNLSTLYASSLFTSETFSSPGFSTKLSGNTKSVSKTIDTISGYALLATNTLSTTKSRDSIFVKMPLLGQGLSLANLSPPMHVTTVLNASGKSLAYSFGAIGGGSSRANLTGSVLSNALVQSLVSPTAFAYGRTDSVSYLKFSASYRVSITSNLMTVSSAKTPAITGKTFLFGSGFSRSAISLPPIGSLILRAISSSVSSFKSNIAGRTSISGSSSSMSFVRPNSKASQPLAAISRSISSATSVIHNSLFFITSGVLLSRSSMKAGVGTTCRLAVSAFSKVSSSLFLTIGLSGNVLSNLKSRSISKNYANLKATSSSVSNLINLTTVSRALKGMVKSVSSLAGSLTNVGFVSFVGFLSVSIRAKALLKAPQIVYPFDDSYFVRFGSKKHHILPSKSPEEEVIITFDFYRGLEQDEVLENIISVKVNVYVGTDPSNSLVTGIAIIPVTNLKVVQVPVSGGLNGVTYKIQVEVQTSLNQLLMTTTTLPVVAQ